QAVSRTNRKFKFVNLAQKITIEAKFISSLFNTGFLRLFKVDEELELILENAGSVSNRIFRADGAIGFDLHVQLVIVEDLPFTGIVDLVADLEDRTVKRIDRNKANRRIFRTVAISRDIALAAINRHFDLEMRAFIEGADHQIGVHDFDVSY